jgi:hypothetical protein
MYTTNKNLGMKVVRDKRNVTDIDNEASEPVSHGIQGIFYHTVNFIAITIRQCLKLSSSAWVAYRTKIYNSLTNRCF